LPTTRNAGREIGILDDGEVLPRTHRSEEALDSAALGLDDLVDLVEVEFEQYEDSLYEGWPPTQCPL
jgi:hypothetical protein